MQKIKRGINRKTFILTVNFTTFKILLEKKWVKGQGIDQENKNMQSHMHILTFFKVKTSQRSKLVAILIVYFWHFPPKIARDIEDNF